MQEGKDATHFLGNMSKRADKKQKKGRKSIPLENKFDT